MADSQRIAGLRGWIKRDDDRREREAALPKAICRVCGGWVRAGEGTRDAEPERGLIPNPLTPGQLMFAPVVNAPANADEWRRECAVCASAGTARIVSAVVGSEVTEDEARAVLGRMKRISDGLNVLTEFPTAEASDAATGKPWRHVTSQDRERVCQVLRQVRDEKRPGVSKWGACGMCGRRHSLRWYEPSLSLTWPDGSRAPVCAECQAVLDRRPDPTGIHALRVIAVEAATGYSQMLYEAPDEFRIYAETRGCDGNGYPEPWDYGEGVRQFREEMWISRPDLAPHNLRGEYQAKAAARHAEEQRQREADAASAW